MKFSKSRILVGSISLLLATPAIAQSAGIPATKIIAAPVEPDAIPLYGAKTPGAAESEIWLSLGPDSLGVRNVSRPTLTPVFPPAGKANGSAVIVAPGGAFMMLAIGNEGTSVARALADQGFTAFILKYRLIETPRDEAEAMRFVGQQMAKVVGSPMDSPLLRQSKAPEDVRAALALVRSNAAKWNIDPARVGIIGFSAGAMAARRVAIDAPAAERPNFVGYIYGPQDAEPIPADAPPLFGAIAWDDPLFPGKGFAFESAWAAAKRPVELHVYQSGGHGFGAGTPGNTNSLLIQEFSAWVKMQHLHDKDEN